MRTMKLTDLSPQFIRYETRVETYPVVDGDPETWRERGCPTKDKTGPRVYRHHVDSLEQAQGITFLCPKCFAANIAKVDPELKGADALEAAGVGIHSVEVTFSGRGALDNEGTQRKTGPVRWDVSGTGYSDLTTKPSILLLCGCEWHGYITNGEIT